jgi:hypothetical protein
MQEFTVVLRIDGKIWSTEVVAKCLFDAQHLAIDQARALHPKSVIKIKL